MQCRDDVPCDGAFAAEAEVTCWKIGSTPLAQFDLGLVRNLFPSGRPQIRVRGLERTPNLGDTVVEITSQMRIPNQMVDDGSRDRLGHA